MSKILLLRIFNNGDTVRGLYSDGDGLMIAEFKAVISWCQDRIAEEEGMKPKGEKNPHE